MKHSSILAKLVLSAYAATLFALPLSARAATTNYFQNTTFTVGSIPLRVIAGSRAQSIVASGTTLTLTLDAGDVVDLRTANPPNIMENDAGEPACNITNASENRLVLNGPRTVVITPNANGCSTAGAGAKQTPYITLSSPNGGETLKEGQSYQLFWQTAGIGIASVSLQYTLDAGATWTTIVDNLLNNGFYSWTVPPVYTSDAARLRIDGFDQGKVVALDVSDANLRLEGSLPPPPPPSSPASLTITPYDYDPAEETRTAATIGIDKGLVAVPASQLVCNPDSRIKVRGMDTVYYCGVDGKRYVFPNRKTHDSWYGSFAGVIELDLADVQRIPLGGNVTYRPGIRLLKIQSAPEVFTVAADGTLRYVSERAVVRMFGPNWNTMVDDLPDAFFADYRLGDAIME